MLTIIGGCSFGFLKAKAAILILGSRLRMKLVLDRVMLSIFSPQAGRSRYYRKPVIGGKCEA
jgi:hypothetical protein